MIHSNSGCSPRAVPIADPSILEAETLETPLRQLSNGFFNPTGALFAVTAFSCSDGKSPLGARRKAQWTGEAPLGSNNPCSTFRSPVPETNGQISRNVCTSTESVLIGSDAEKKGYDDAMWEGDYDEPILSIQWEIRPNTPRMVQKLDLLESNDGRGMSALFREIGPNRT